MTYDVFQESASNFQDWLFSRKPLNGCFHFTYRLFSFLKILYWSPASVMNDEVQILVYLFE